jgi:hypothetical protein
MKYPSAGQGELTPTLVPSPSGVRHLVTIFNQDMLNLDSKTPIYSQGGIFTMVRTTLNKFRVLTIPV